MVMTTMIERLARAIYAKCWDMMPAGAGLADWDNEPDDAKARMFEYAQAVLREMLVISKPMIDAFENEAYNWARADFAPYFSCDGTVPTWQAAIQAAIDEGEG